LFERRERGIGDLGVFLGGGQAGLIGELALLGRLSAGAERQTSDNN
jgi:hypothetical protein